MCVVPTGTFRMYEHMEDGVRAERIQQYFAEGRGGGKDEDLKTLP